MNDCLITHSIFIALPKQLSCKFSSKSESACTKVFITGFLTKISQKKIMQITA